MSKHKRVLFIERNLRNEKLGVMYLSAALKAAGHHADLVQTDKTDLDQRLADYRPHFVAFSITTGEHLFALQTARRLKQTHNIPNVFGGPHCTYFPEIALEPGVDFVVQGQGERAILDIVEGRAAPGFIKSDMADHLDEFAFPDREIFYQFDEFRRNPMKNVITSRACPYKCSYCFNHSQLALTRIDGETRQWFDRRSIENVTAEIRQIADRYPLEKILFVDDSFIQSRDWLHAFLDGYTRDVRLPWLCSLRVNCLDETLAEKMFASGLEMVNYAMESADPDVQQRLLHRGHISNGDVIRAIRLFDQFGVRARMQNMIGLPLSNPLEDALNTLQFNMRHRVIDSWCSIFQPYPRTALGQYCLDHGFTTADQLRHCSESFFDESRLDLPDKNELYALQKLWYFIIDGRLPLDLVQILIRGRFTPDIGNELQKLRFRCSRKKLYGIDDGDPDTAVNLQSRERLAPLNDTPIPAATASERSSNRAATVRERSSIRAASPDDTLSRPADLVRAALHNAPVPDRLIDLLARVEFAPRERELLHHYLAGDRAYPDPIYTVNDETGELLNPDCSIFIRGTDQPDAHDIRHMPEPHFMRGMVDVRHALRRHDPAELDPAQLDPAQERVPLDVLSHAGPSTNRPTTTDSADTDERHLNQYLA